MTETTGAAGWEEKGQLPHALGKWRGSARMVGSNAV